jgi:hypothetical protein
MILRKVVQHGEARGVDFPKAWLDDLEKRIGSRLEYVEIKDLASGSLQIVPLIQRQVSTK